MPGLRMTAALPSALLLLLAACAVETPEASDPQFSPGFSAGTDAELSLIEDVATDVLFAADGAASLKGVTELRFTRLRADDEGIAHARARQLHEGVPVWGGEAIVHLRDDGSTFAVTDDLVAGIRVDSVPELDLDEAADLAVGDLLGGWDVLTDDPETDLWVLRHEGEDHLVWRVQLRSIDGIHDPTMPVGFIDAHTGELVWSYENLQTDSCTGTTNFYGTPTTGCYSDGTSWYTEDTTRKVATYSYNNTTTSLYYVSSTSSTFPATSATYKNAYEAHYAATATYDFYLAAYGRNGIDGAGGPAGVTSHGVAFMSSYTSYSTNYVNAFWDGTGMTYGDGDGVNSGSLTTLDIAGHEMTHGVTQYEANLTYSGEPGHLNESISDVFGAMVERSVSGESSNTWLVGETTWTPGTSGDALRYMADPAADGYSKDYYSSSIGSVDVHYGSGVPNLAFYLMAKGGTHPRGKSTVAVTGIGADKAAAIWYNALANYMTSSTNFSGARTAMINAATATYGATSAEVQAVTNAWAAVGVGSAYGGGGGSTTCTTTTYTGSLSRTGKTAYAPSSSGKSVGAVTQTLSLAGPSSADFDIYLQKKSGRSWVDVASGTTSTSTESVSYAGSSATYRVFIKSASGGGSFSLAWCI